MPRNLFVDFKSVKSAITMEQVLEHYDLRKEFKQSGDSLSGPCPIHGGSNPTQFRISLSKNIWNCFSKCKRGGNVLDFIAKKEDVSIHAAALKAIDWFGIDADAMKGDSEDEQKAVRNGKPESSSSSKPSVPKTQPKQEEDKPNKALKFKLDKLEREHPYLIERGLSPETVAAFEMGYCTKGMMAGLIAIPIYDSAGFIVAYAGRFPGDPPENTPKYKFPPEFRKTRELFNFDRALRESPENPWIIVEGFFDCMKLHELGYRKVVALMGSFMSPKQEELLKKSLTPESRVILMLDEDEAGQEAREAIAHRLAKFAFVRIHVFDTAGAQPDQLSYEELSQIVGGAL
jgi:DNA primase